MKESFWRQAPYTLLIAAWAVVAAITVFVFFLGSAEKAVAAERVLEPDRFFSAQPEPQPVDPLLLDGEDMRYPTSYRESTASLWVDESSLCRGFLILANYSRLLPEGYTPADLVLFSGLAETAAPAALSVTKAMMEIDRTAGEKLLALAAYAKEKDGVGDYLLQSGYRDFAYQSALYRKKVQDYRGMGYSEAAAGAAASFWVARPRESEHHTGLAMDVSSRSHPDLQPSYADTANGRWLAENSWRFGFIIRYPEDKSGVTQIGFEPWHLRYVGRPHSDVIHQKGWCLEEYLDFLAGEGGFTFRDEDGGIWQVDYQPLGNGVIQAPSALPYTISGDGGKGFIITTLLAPPSGQ